ncbi:MAG: hypothetical protein OEY05_02000 [Paracoccaceae bacterium]|nr:hypothetical protein [Paracoccaceae bacterium]MDH5528783.1 hypothetical protein [Paracoccaceae bacterium]
MKAIALLLSILTVAACGADGKPTPPESGLSVSGQVKVGIGGSL